MQLPVWVALELRQKVNFQDIESICVFLERRSVVTRAEGPEYWDPQSREMADHSYPYLIGAAMVDGEITAATFTPQRYRDPEILALIQKIRMQEDAGYTAAFPRTVNCRFEVILKSGDKITVHQANPKGHPANPMSDLELEAKFLRQVNPLLDDKGSRVLLDQLWQIDDLDDLAKLFACMLLPALR